MADPKFTEKEVGKIIADAMRRQQTAHQERHGLTTDELKQVAAEMGIDDAFVEDAIAAERLQVENKGEKFFGAPAQLVMERTFMMQISDTEWQQIVELLRTEHGVAGAPATYGPNREWTTDRTPNGMPASLQLLEVDGRTKIRYRIDYRQQRFITAFLPALFGVLGFIIMAAGSELALLLPAIPFGLTIFGILYTLIRWAFTRSVAKQRRNGELLMSRIREIAGSDAPTVEKRDLSGQARLSLSADEYGTTNSKTTSHSDRTRTRL